MSTILVVDDDPAVLRLVLRMLEREGYRVHAAKSPSAAIAIAEQLQCGLDLLLTDMAISETDGHNLILTIRRLCPRIKTMAISGALPPGDFRRDYEVLRKPFTRDQLLADVKQILNPQAKT